MSYTVSHFEIRARDPAAMEKFYTDVLGFIVSDRGVLDAGPMKGRYPFEMACNEPRWACSCQSMAR